MLKKTLPGLQKYLCCTICALLFLSLAAPCLAVSDGQTLKVAFYQLDGFFEYAEDGTETGYGVDLLKKISEYTGIRFEYVPADTWEQTKKMLLSGEADIRMPGTLPSAPSTDLGYTGESVVETYHALMALNSRDDLYYKDYENFAHLKIAISKYLYGNTAVHKYLDDVGITAENLVFFDGYAPCREALDKGEVDAVISNIMDLTDDMKILARFNSVSNYISMPLGSPYLEVLENALHEIKMDDPTFIPALYQTYYPERTVVPFTREEAEYIKSAGVITIGNLPNRHPFSSYDEKSGTLSGITEEILAWIGEYTGLEFQQLPIDLTEKPISALKSGKFDIVAGIIKNQQFERDNTIILSDSFNSSSISVVKRKDYFFDPQAVQTVAVKTSFQAMQYYIKENYPQYSVTYRDTDEQCLDAVMSGEADVMLQNVYVINHLLQKPKYQSIEMLPTSFVTEENCVAVLSSDADNAILISIINKAIKMLPEETRNSIILANTTAEPYEYTLEDTYYKFKSAILIIGVLLFVALCLCTVILIVRHKNAVRIKRKNVQLAEAYQQAQVASLAKGEFLARMSHEIRTPMNAIIGMTTLAMDHADTPELVREDLSKVALSSRMLLSIINDVLDMSAIESGKLQIAQAPFDFKQLITSLTTVYYAQCQAKGISFEVKITGAVDETLIGDQLRLNQILMNLLSNAVKFTDCGTVSLVINKRLIGQDKLFLEIRVLDTGCGMNEEMLSRLGRPFEQANARTAQEHGGSGLGLSIVKSLVGLMNGSFDVQSSEGEGSAFFVGLPLERFTQGETRTISETQKLRVLVVDDEQDARDYAATVLKHIGVRSSCAVSGEKALQMLRQAAAECDPFNVCIIDWKMPEMNGVEVTKRIRAEFGSDSVVIIASAYDYSEMEGEATWAGADRFVTKPLFQSTVFDLLMSLSGGRLAKSGAADALCDFSGRRVLMAEDNDINCIVGVGLLGKANIVCETAANGEIALDMFSASAPGYYDAVLMDVQMPVMDGYEATKTIRASAHPEANTIPIIAMTANAFTKDVSAALQCGMNDHVAKPIELSTLLAALERAFKEREDKK